MALSRRAKLAIGGAVFAGAAALTTTGMAYAAAEQPTLRITVPVDDGGTGVADGSGGCQHDGTGSGGASGSAASEQ